MPSIQVAPALMWDVIKATVPVFISGCALFFVLKDRRPKMYLGAKRGDWCKLRMTLDGSEVMFQGVIEVYNGSSRANAIRGYAFKYKASDGRWREMEYEQYTNKE